MPSITAEHFHSHIRRRMEQRGITEEEVRKTLREGWDAPDAKPGSEGRTLVFTYDAVWEGTHYEEKEVTVYFKLEDEQLVLLTPIARYGNNFPREDSS
ncbi:DUF4258 domain-containing protein [Salinibacter sp.]|uniref:DUF4258 domain-containing protein n=1 Tax=Salinibacter sp. TaxID=2065818 RepID=UPI0021E944CA|nr:DUF4258 domain-containing protein [Salinibacter sp.]